MKKWNEIVSEASDKELFNQYLMEVGIELNKDKQGYSPSAVSMYREKIKKLGAKLGFSNQEIDEKIEESYQKMKKLHKR
jgi:carbamoylphosphate synthase large subunit